MTEIRRTAIFLKWLRDLRDVRARARIQIRNDRLSLGNPGDATPVGEGVSEMRIDYGSWISCLFCPAWQGSRRLALWRQQTNAGRGYR
jgi:putative addiction module killer protein